MDYVINVWRNKMYNNKYKKILILCFIIIFVTMSVGTGILAENTLHTEHCNIQNCSICNLIHFARYFTENMIIWVSNILILGVSIPIIRLINQNKDTVEKQTLVKLKVIQNK